MDLQLTTNWQLGLFYTNRRGSIGISIEHDRIFFLLLNLTLRKSNLKLYIEPTLTKCEIVKVSLSFSDEGFLIDKTFSLLRLKFRLFTIFLKLCNLPALKTRHYDISQIWFGGYA